MIPDTLRCSHCGSNLPDQALSCRHCGTISQAYERSVECENHGGQPAVGFCSVCTKPVCGDCAVSNGGKIYCELLEHREFENVWTILTQTRSGFESDILARNLAGIGVECKTFSLGDHTATYWILDEMFTNVFVPRGELKKAKTHLVDLGLLDDSSHVVHL